MSMKMKGYNEYMDIIYGIICKYKNGIICSEVCDNMLTSILIELDCIEKGQAERIMRKRLVNFINDFLNNIDEN